MELNDSSESCHRNITGDNLFDLQGLNIQRIVPKCSALNLEQNNEN